MAQAVIAAAHQSADIERAVIVGRQPVIMAVGDALEAVAGGGAVGNNAIVPPGQHTGIDLNGAAVQPSGQAHRLLILPQHGEIAHLTAAGHGGKQPHAAAGAGDGNNRDTL